MTAYFDAASTAPPHPVAREAFLAAWDEGWADPARLHRDGRRARILLDSARESVAEQVGARADEVVFTSSGTRALHTAIAGSLRARRRTGHRLLLSAVEHSAVLHAGESHARARAERDQRPAGGEHADAAEDPVALVPVDRTGRTAPETWESLLTPATALAALQSANHEVGTEQPVEEVAAACRALGVPLLVDAAQSLPWGRVAGDWSLLTASAHKWGGPAGTGVLVVRKGVRFSPPQPADDRESGRAPGFPALPSIVAAAASLRAVRQRAETEGARLRALVDRIRTEVARTVPDTDVVGDPRRRLPHIVTFSCLYADGEALLHALDRAGFAVSSGSSCTSSTLEPSHVLRAMGVLSEGNIRISLPVGTGEDQVAEFLRVLPETVAGVRGRLDAPGRAGADAPTAAAPDAARARASAGAGAPVAVSGEPEMTVDARGTRCPVPVIEMAKVFPRLAVGGVVTVLADDAAARLDIPAWCEMREQEYLGARPASPSGTAYRVRRRD